MTTVWTIGRIAALMLLTTPATAAQCKVGEIYRPSINVCVSKDSPEARQILGINKKQRVVTRAASIPPVSAKRGPAFEPEEVGSVGIVLSYDPPTHELSLWPLQRADVFDWSRVPR